MACEDDRLPGYTFVWRAATWGTSSSTRTRILFIFSWVHRSMSESESPAIALLKLAPSGSILAWNQPFICQRGPQFGLSVVQTSAPETPPRISSNQVFMTDSMRSSLRSVSAGLSRCSLWPVAVAASTGEISRVGELVKIHHAVALAKRKHVANTNLSSALQGMRFFPRRSGNPTAASSTVTVQESLWLFPQANTIG